MRHSNSKIVGLAIDPIRNPLIQKTIEGGFEKNYKKTISVLTTDILKILKKKGNE